MCSLNLKLVCFLMLLKNCHSQSLPPQCLQQIDQGQGRNWVQRWYYDSRMNRCTQFHYSGRGGNSNNFFSREACQSTCFGVSPISYCSDPLKEYSQCGSACPRGCDNLQSGTICTLQCVSGCFCKYPTYVFLDSRDFPNSPCVLVEQCPTRFNYNLNGINTGFPLISSRQDQFGQLRNIGSYQAIAVISSYNTLNDINGALQFFDDPINRGGVSIRGNLRGLPPGTHGITVHEFGDVSSQCFSTGRHFDLSRSQRHGNPASSQRHTGDLGNIFADRYGNAIVDIFDQLISLSGVNNILGRAIVIHERPDDLGASGQPDGNSGPGIACGVIGLANINRIIKRRDTNVKNETIINVEKED